MGITLKTKVGNALRKYKDGFGKTNTISKFDESVTDQEWGKVGTGEVEMIRVVVMTREHKAGVRKFDLDSINSKNNCQCISEVLMAPHWGAWAGVLAQLHLRVSKPRLRQRRDVEGWCRKWTWQMGCRIGDWRRHGTAESKHSSLKIPRKWEK